MKQLGKVLNKTSWAQASNTINTNSESVFSAVTMLENAAFKHKGYFLTSEEVEQLCPSAEEGSQAFVYNPSNPSTAPYDIYQMIGGTWVDTGLNGGSVSVDLTKKQDTLVGYSESVSGGKATQVAIQGDVIALGGKVSLGSVDNMESAILMSSSQAGAAIAKANTLEQSMSALKSPVKPIHLNSQGKLELNIGKGLYVEDGKLCTTGASGGGGGGTTLSEGDGIRIYNDTINVEYDIDTLKVNSCGGLTVNYGEGLTIKNGKLSAQASVNAGNGLVKKGEELSVNISTGLQYGSDGELSVKTGKGLSVDNTGTINANIDNSTIATNSGGAMYVQKGMLAGQGLKVSLDRLAVNYGNGLTISNGALVVKPGAGLAFDSCGKLYSTVSSGKTYTAGDGIDIRGNKIAVLYGSGLTTNTCGKLIVDAANLTVGYADYAYYAPTSCSAQYASYAESADHATVSCSASYASSAGKATADANGNNIAETYLKSVDASGDGISISGGKIAVKYCDGLRITNGSLAIATGDGLHIKDNTLAINPSNGLGFTIDGLLKLKLHEKSGLQTTSDGLGVNAGVALSTSDGKLNVQYGTGLGKSTDNKLQVLLGTGLAVEGNYIRVEEAVYDSIEEANAGVSRAHEVVTKLQTALGGKQNTLTLATGLEWGKTDMIQVKMNAPLSYDEGGRLKLNHDSTLTVSDGKLGVSMYGIMDNEGGLTLKNNGLAVNVGQGLKIESCQVVVNYGTGMSESNNKIYVDTSKIAGVGIDLDSDLKKLTIGTKAAKELAGTGLAADGPKIKVKYGSGLTTNSCGGLIVDAAKLTVGNATNATYLDGIHANYYTPRDRSVNGEDMNAQKESAIYMGYNMKNSAVTEISSFLLCRYSDDWGAQMQFSLVSGNVYVRFWQNAGGIMGTWKELAYKDGTVAKAEASTKFTKANYEFAGIRDCNVQTCGMISNYYGLSMWRNTPSDMSYGRVLSLNDNSGYKDLLGQLAWDINHGSTTDTTRNLWWRASDDGSMTEAKWHQIAFMDVIDKKYAGHFWPGQGINLSNDRVLSLPNLTASVANGAVDGIKNNKQRVLELSCGAIQIKLSTGLAIDDNGYLYVQDKYVTK